ncbi:MAG TPA: signal peptidase I [Dermatophilaceae bacterium]|jgi:signal peptidase I
MSYRAGAEPKAAPGPDPQPGHEDPPGHEGPPDQEDLEPTPLDQRIWSFLREAAVIVIASIVVSMVIKTFFVQAFFVPSGSMEPTLHGCTGCLNDRVLVNKQTSHLGGVYHGDVVVFHDSDGWLPREASTAGVGSRVHEALTFIGLTPSSSESNLVKRVIGVGGDTVEGRDGKVYLNGTLLDEPYVFPGNPSSEINFKVTVPADRLWVMGDHRSESLDSRFHQEDPGKGFVPLSDVVGRAVAIVWPLDRAGALGRPATFDRPAVSSKR